jgi:hypothetical protein
VCGDKCIKASEPGRHLKEVAIDVRIILKWMLVVDFYGHGYEVVGGIKYGEFLE